MEKVVLIVALFVEVCDYICLYFNSTSEPVGRSQAFSIFMAISTTNLPGRGLEGEESLFPGNNELRIHVKIV